MKFNVVTLCLNNLFVTFVFFSRSANAQLRYPYFPPPDFYIFRRGKKQKKSEVSKKAPRCCRWRVCKGGVFWREKNSIWSKTVVIFMKKHVPKRVILHTSFASETLDLTWQLPCDFSASPLRLPCAILIYLETLFHFPA